MGEGKAAEAKRDSPVLNNGEGEAAEAKRPMPILNSGEHGTTTPEIEKREEWTLTSLLAPPDDRNFVITNEGKKVRVSKLNDKAVGLYFFCPSVNSCLKFNEKLLKVYKELKEEETFEIVMVFSNDLGDDEGGEDDDDEEDDDDADEEYYSDGDEDDFDDDIDEFYASFINMPWLALPCKDKRSTKLVEKLQVKSFPTLFVIRSNEALDTCNAVEAIENCGSKALRFL
ncbi:hypothetical protein NMG60_11006140 [Bertholletia excelsa]